MSTYVTSVTRNYTSILAEEVHTSLQQYPVQVAFITIGAAFCFYLTIMLTICIRMYSRHMKDRRIYMKKFRRKILENIATANPEAEMKSHAMIPQERLLDNQSDAMISQEKLLADQSDAMMSQNSPFDQSEHTSAFQTKQLSDINKTSSNSRGDNIPDTRYEQQSHM